VYTSVPLPRYSASSDHQSIISDIETWSTSAPMRDLVQWFDHDWPTGNLVNLLAELDRISEISWDFRRGRERDGLHRHEFSTLLSSGVLAATTALGLTECRTPRRRRYDHVLILGGLLRACFARAAFAAHLTGESVDAGHVCGLGSFRSVTADEVDLARRMGLAAYRHEFDEMDDAVRRAFGASRAQNELADINTIEPNSSAMIRRYALPAAPQVAVIAAPSAEPAVRRTNTADTYHFWAEQVARLKTGAQILLVTSSIYVPFQHCDAIRVLGLNYDVEIETVGIDLERIEDANLRQTFTTESYLQEVRSAIRSMRALHTALCAIPKGAVG
jgi:hypothetical protein